MTAARLDETPGVLVDPNTISPDGSLAFAGYVASNDGRRLAYGLAVGGGDWQRWRIRAVGTPATPGVDEPDQLEHIKYYAPAFSPDGKGLFYSRFRHCRRGRSSPRPITIAGSTSMRSVHPLRRTW